MYVYAKVSHVSTYPNPIHFEAGDRVAVGREDDEFPGWVRVRTRDGNEGWAPEQFLDAVDAGYGIANTTYTARELTTMVGERLRCLKTVNDWHWVANNAGATGWVPARTTEISVMEDDT